MFLLGAFIKSVEKTGNKLKITGIASSPIVDRTNERFAEGCIQKMCDDLTNKKLPIRVEHQNAFYADIGEWTKGWVVDDYLRVEGEVDLDFSLARDVEVILSKGGTIGLSVGGKVITAKHVFNDDGSSTKVYEDVTLDEISIVKTPANSDAYCTLAKSYNADDGQETEVAKSLSEMIKTKVKKDISEMPSLLPYAIFNKDCTECCICEVEECNIAYCSVMEIMEEELEHVSMWSVPTMLSSDMVRLFVSIGNILKMIDITKIVKPDMLIGTDEEVLARLQALPEECFVPNTGRDMPHHNPDYSVNYDCVKYYVARLLSGGYERYTPKQYVDSLYHLYLHLLEMKKTAQKSETIDVASLMKSCYVFKTLKTGDRPQVEGNDLSDKEVTKFADLYVGLLQKSKTTIGSNIVGAFKKSNEEVVEEALEVVADVVEAPEAVEEVTEAVETEEVAAEVAEEITEAVETEATEAVEEVTTKSEETTVADDVVSTEEATTDSVTEDVEQSTVEGESTEATTEDVTEPVVIAEENTPAEEATPTIADEVVAPVVEEVETVTKEQVEAIAKEYVETTLKSYIDAEIQKMVNASLESVQKSTNDKTDELTKSLEKATSLIETMSSKIGFRKTYGTSVALEKSAETNKPTSREELTKYYVDQGLDLQSAYKKSLEEIPTL